MTSTPDSLLSFYLANRSGNWSIDSVTKDSNPGTGFVRWLPEIKSVKDVTDEMIAKLREEINCAPMM